jgi:hypothetical protein
MESRMTCWGCGEDVLGAVEEERRRERIDNAE